MINELSKCVGCEKVKKTSPMNYPGCSNNCYDKNPRVGNKKKDKGVKYTKSGSDYPSTKRVNIFIKLSVGFEDYVVENKIPFRPGAFGGAALSRQGNTYFEFGDQFDKCEVEGKIKTNIVNHSYTLLGQAHRELEDYKKMIIESFKKGNKKEVVYDGY